jgi:hypothetical protein
LHSNTLILKLCKMMGASGQITSSLLTAILSFIYKFSSFLFFLASPQFSETFIADTYCRLLSGILCICIQAFCLFLMTSFTVLLSLQGFLPHRLQAKSLSPFFWSSITCNLGT